MIYLTWLFRSYDTFLLVQQSNEGCRRSRTRGDNFEHRTLIMSTTYEEKQARLGRQKVRVHIILQTEADVERTIDILNSLKNEINQGLSGIEFIVAQKGCIVLNIALWIDLLETDERLQSVLALFMEKILEHMMTSIAQSSDIVILLIEEFQLWNISKTNAEPVYLNFDLDDDLFETDDKMETELKHISETFGKHFNGSGTNSNITASLLPISLETTEAAFAQAQSVVKYNLPVLVTLQKHLNIELLLNDSLFICGYIKLQNKLVLIDASYYNRLIICNIDETDFRTIPLSHKPDYITEVDINTVAVSCIYKSTILIINIYVGEISSVFKIGGIYHGLSYDAYNVYTVCGDKSIHVTDMTGNVIRVIPIPYTLLSTFQFNEIDWSI
ncbi:unnamed protein product [Mytilus edulis]|uniref:Uncharacterized protein n=1 Tax=Mytilus edulis TaxID=6550 RepID=A0A8S3PZM0_MYTED|nr:unnamed protein product [Mytilus edulis]